MKIGKGKAPSTGKLRLQKIPKKRLTSATTKCPNSWSLVKLDSFAGLVGSRFLGQL